MTFNPFEFIFTLEGFVDNPTLYDEEKLIHIMDFIKLNKDDENCISLINEEMKKIGDFKGDAKGGASAVPSEPVNELDQTLDADIKPFIESAEKIINKDLSKPDSNLLIVNLSNKISNMVRNEHLDKLDMFLNQSIKIIEYLITILDNYITVLSDSPLKTDTNQRDANDVLKFVNDAKQNVVDVEKSGKFPNEPPVKFVNDSNETTINNLKEMLTTTDISLNIAAAKGILAASIAFSIIACLSVNELDNTRPKHIEKGKKMVTDILTKSMHAIYDKIGSSDSGTGSTDIKARIIETISFLKEMCTSENMMEIFMKIIYLIEKPEDIT